jgi:ATP-binding cassette subfamily C (CFTR/MRP) protein 4
MAIVDSKVGRLLFYSAIQDLGLKRGKCIVLVTHQHQFIGDSRCVMMSAGSIAYIGTYHKCVEEAGGRLEFALQVKEIDSEETFNRPVSIQDEVDVSVQVNDTSSDESENKDASTTSKSEHKEKIQSGIVKRETFLNYMRVMPGGLWTGMFMLFLFIATQGSAMVTIAAIGKWAGLPAAEQDSGVIIGVIVVLVLATCLLFILRSFSSLCLTAEVSRRIHDQMLIGVLRSKIQFFDTNPIGRILNRFSGDVGNMDHELPVSLMDFIYFSSIVLGALISTVSLIPVTFAALPPLVFCFLKLKGTFMRTSRELKRLDGAARSPIAAMLSESLSGIAVIRTNNAIDYFQQKFREVHDVSTVLSEYVPPHLHN